MRRKKSFECETQKEKGELRSFKIEKKKEMDGEIPEKEGRVIDRQR